MNLIRQWECPEHGAERIGFDGLREVYRCVVGDPPCRREAVEVEYVPRDDYEGAIRERDIQRDVAEHWLGVAIAAEAEVKRLKENEAV